MPDYEPTRRSTPFPLNITVINEDAPMSCCDDEGTVFCYCGDAPFTARPGVDYAL